MQQTTANSNSARIFLIDAMALLYRSYFAFIKRPLINSKGQNISAIVGFYNTLDALIQEYQPTHLAVCFDHKEATFRHREFPAYKAQRDAAPDDLIKAITWLKELLQLLQITAIECPGYEADDIMGTLAKKLKTADSVCYLVTPDKDFAQLVDEQVLMYRPGKRGDAAVILDIASVCEEWGIAHPQQVQDILALWGDAADNIPGITGVGEKTAKNLIQQYQSIAGIWEHQNELKPKLQQQLSKQREELALFQRLVTIDTAVPLTTELSDLCVKTADYEKLIPWLQRYELNQIQQKITKQIPAKFQLADTVTMVETKTFKQYQAALVDYQHVISYQQWQNLLAVLQQSNCYCFDVETTSLDVAAAELLGIAFCLQNNTAYYLDLTQQQLTLENVKADLITLLNNPKQTKIGHNLKYDIAVLKHQQIAVSGPFFDTMSVHMLIAKMGKKHDLNSLAKTYLHYQPIELTSIAQAVSNDDLFEQAKRKKQPLDMRAIPSAKLAVYACEDADVTWQIAAILEEELAASGQMDVYYQIEAPLLPVLVAMEYTGIKCNRDALHKLSLEMATKLQKIVVEISQFAEAEVNLNSPKQLGQLLFEKLHIIDKPKKTKTGQYKTDELTLQTLREQHPIVPLILQYREYSKLQSTYIQALPQFIDQKSQRIHSTFHPLLTHTGRLSSTQPNLQNIPIKSTYGKKIRQCFIPCTDAQLLCVDYSQIELRIMAALANEETMIADFKQGLDIHQMTAARIFQVEPTTVNAAMRRQAKVVNFGVLYGMSSFGLAQKMAVSRAEAKVIIDAYFSRYSRIVDYTEQVLVNARELGYVETLTGRRRLMPDLHASNAVVRKNAERAALNMPIQGTSADMIKLAMIQIQQHLQKRNYQSKMILQVHDELIFDLHHSEKDILPEEIKMIMANALILPQQVPVEVNYGIGKHWLAAH